MFELEISPEIARRGFIHTLPRRRCRILGVILSIAVGMSVFGLGCQDVRTIWSAEARSPDGHWLAIARTIQHFGPGTAGVQTSVYLKRTNDSNRAMEILGFLHSELDTSHTIHLEMKWLTSFHLDVTYSGEPDLYFQVVKLGGVDISVRDVSSRSVDTSQ